MTKPGECPWHEYQGADRTMPKFEISAIKHRVLGMLQAVLDTLNNTTK